MRVKLHELRQVSSLETRINELDNLASYLELPEQQKILYFIFRLKPKLKQALLIRQSQTYDDAVTFAKRKHHFADVNSDTQLMDLPQESRKESSSSTRESNKNRIQQLSKIPMPTIFNETSPKLKRICKFSRNQ